MLKKSLLAASLSLLAVGLGRPAAAAPVYLEPYGEIFGARTILGSREDLRPKDALQEQGSRLEPESYPVWRVAVTPFVRLSSIPAGTFGDRIDTLAFGGGLAFASSSWQNHPWQLNFNYLTTNVEIDRIGFDDDFSSYDINGKFVVWQADDARWPVVSLIGRYQRFLTLGERTDVMLAFDQAVMRGPIGDTKWRRDLYVTENIGYAWQNLLRDEENIIFGVGLTWAALQNWSLSFDYVPEQDVDGRNHWGISTIYTFARDHAVRLGGGKDRTFFGNYIYKYDIR
jgi:hypothetical protein